jgi:carbamoyl-phosphate synthase small subunit
MKLDIPIMGVCLGHQLMALALGGETRKLSYGHRGGNQPVSIWRRAHLLTTQNHGYAVVDARFPPQRRLCHPRQRQR